MRHWLLVLFFTLLIASSQAQTRFLPLSDFRFNGITAQYQDDTTTVYSLLCTGTTKSDANADSLIHTWLTTHPDATLRPVCSFSYYNIMGKRVTFTYAWIVSNIKTDPSLNTYLVRNGNCSANSMLWAKNASILKPAIDHYKKMNSETKIFVDAATYKNFTRELRQAQTLSTKHVANTKK